jgi:hypothetical protein
MNSYIMKFTVDKQHRDYFQKNGFIEFENFLSPDRLQLFNSAIDQSLVNRTSVPEHELRRLDSEQLFLQSRDMWRFSPELRKLICHPHLGEQVSELIEKKPIRLGYDQFFPAPPLQVSRFEKVQSKYRLFLEQKTNLESISSITDILCGLMICLSKSGSHEEKNELLPEGEVDLFPSKAGNAIFFQPELVVDFDQLFEHAGQRYYLIVYTHSTSLYHQQPNDPFGHALKHLGYIFNDRLSDKLNPIIYR